MILNQKKKVKAAIYPLFFFFFFLVICIKTRIDRNKTFHGFYQIFKMYLDTVYFIVIEKLLSKVL